MNELLHGGLVTLGPWVDANRGVVIVCAIAVLIAHELLARRGGLYAESASTRAATVWAERFRVYAWSSACVFFLPVIVVIARRFVLH